MCLALKLKECPSCHSILRSVCSKAKCKTNGKKPEMIILVKTKKSAKPLQYDSDSDTEEDIDERNNTDSESDNETDLNEMETDDTDDEQNANKKAEDQMKLTWSSISLPNAEESI